MLLHDPFPAMMVGIGVGAMAVSCCIQSSLLWAVEVENMAKPCFYMKVYWRILMYIEVYWCTLMYIDLNLKLPFYVAWGAGAAKRFSTASRYQVLTMFAGKLRWSPWIERSGWSKQVWQGVSLSNSMIIQMGGSINWGYPHSWMVYKGQLERMMAGGTWGTSILGTPKSGSSWWR